MHIDHCWYPFWPIWTNSYTFLESHLGIPRARYGPNRWPEIRVLFFVNTWNALAQYWSATRKISEVNKNGHFLLSEMKTTPQNPYHPIWTRYLITKFYHSCESSMISSWNPGSLVWFHPLDKVNKRYYFVTTDPKSVKNSFHWWPHSWSSVSSLTMKFNICLFLICIIRNGVKSG